jgi:MFS family permease
MVDRRRSGKEQRPMRTQGIGLHLRIFLPFACGYFLSYLYRTVNAVMAPNLAADLGLDPSALGLLTSAYFISFASAQLPLGVLLDRFGPRRIEAVLLLFAASGAFLFARGESLAELVIGRALIGFGVSACLMAAFKAFVEWFPRRQLPLINGIQMASGGLGALSATAPVEYAVDDGLAWCLHRSESGDADRGITGLAGCPGQTGRGSARFAKRTGARCLASFLKPDLLASGALGNPLPGDISIAPEPVVGSLAERCRRA